MLSKILSKEECASCRFCCSFRRQSLWEVPVFSSENLEAIDKSGIDSHKTLKPFEKEGITYATYDLSGNYLTDDSEEETPCPFLDPKKGCVLSDEEKPWDCKIWPFRVVKEDGGVPFVALTPTCPGINKYPLSEIEEFADDEFKNNLLSYAKEHPYLIKEFRNGFHIKLNSD